MVDISGFIFASLLAKNIPVRGTITFGKFTVRPNDSGRDNIYFGKPLIGAYEAERLENWIGITLMSLRMGSS